MGKTEFTFYNFKISSSMERSEEMYETVVMGSGPAGLSAALYLKRAGKNVVIIEKEYEGTGQIARSICVDNYLGVPSVSGECWERVSGSTFCQSRCRSLRMR